MKLRLPSLHCSALLACMACTATVQADTYLAEGINRADLIASERFYDGGKGSYFSDAWSTFIANAMELFYKNNQKDNSFQYLGKLYDRIPADYQENFDRYSAFSNRTNDGGHCRAYTSGNLLQYWQTYYGVFSKKADTLTHGHTYDKAYLEKLGGTQSLNINMAFYDSGKDTGGEVQYALSWHLGGVNGYSGLKNPSAEAPGYGYFKEFFPDAQTTSGCNTTTNIHSGVSLADFSHSIKTQFGYEKQLDGSYQLTTKGQILYLELGGVGIAGSHAITCYGFETDADGNVTALHVTNSDDQAYELFTLTVKKTDKGYQLYDASGALTWNYAGKNWQIFGFSSIATPQVLKDMLAEYETGKLTWMGNLEAWTNSPAVAADVNVLPTDATGWMTYAGTGTNHAGYYNSYYTEGRGVEFNDEATSGSVCVAEDITTPSMSVNNNTLAYIFDGGETVKTITVNEFTKTGSGSVQFTKVNLDASTVQLEGDVRFDALHVTGTLNAASKRLHASSLTLGGDATIGSLGDDGANHGGGTTALTINGGTTTIQNNWAWTNLQSLTLSDSAKLTVRASLSIAGNISPTSDSLPAGGSADINTTYCLYVGTEGDVSTGHAELAGNITAGAYIEVLGNATVSGSVSSNANAWGDADSYIVINGNASIGGNVSARKHLSIGGHATVGGNIKAGTAATIGGNITMAAGKTLTAESLSVSGDLGLNSAAPEGSTASLTTTGSMTLGGTVSKVSLTAQSITMGAASGNALTLDSAEITLTGGSLTLNNVIVTGDCHFSNTADEASGIVNLTAENVTFMLDENNSSLATPEPQPFTMMLLSESALAETPAKTLIIDSGMLSNLNVTGSITLDLSSYAQEIQQGGYDSITLAFADDMSYTENTTVQATLNGTHFVTAAPTGDNMPSFSVSQLAVPEPTPEPVGTRWPRHPPPQEQVKITVAFPAAAHSPSSSCDGHVKTPPRTYTTRRASRLSATAVPMIHQRSAWPMVNRGLCYAATFPSAKPNRPARRNKKSTDFGAAAEAGAFIHGEHAGGDITVDDGVLIEVAAIAADITVNLAIDVHLTGLNIALDIGHFADGDLAGLRLNFTVNLTVNVHIVLEADGTDNLNTGSQNVRGVVVHVVNGWGL